MKTNYDDLVKKAISPYATQANVNALGFWLQKNNIQPYNVNNEACFIIDKELYLKPIRYKGDTVGYEFIGENAPKRKITYGYWLDSNDGFFDFFVCSHCGHKTKKTHLPSCCPSCDSIMIK